MRQLDDEEEGESKCPARPIRSSVYHCFSPISHDHYIIIPPLHPPFFFNNISIKVIIINNIFIYILLLFNNIFYIYYFFSLIFSNINYYVY